MKLFPRVKLEAAVMSIYDQLIIGEGDVGCATSYRVPLRVARVRKFKINVTSHLKNNYTHYQRLTNLEV